MADVLYDWRVARGRKKAWPRATCLVLTPSSILRCEFHLECLRWSILLECDFRRAENLRMSRCTDHH